MINGLTIDNDICVSVCLTEGVVLHFLSTRNNLADKLLPEIIADVIDNTAIFNLSIDVSFKVGTVSLDLDLGRTSKSFSYFFWIRAAGYEHLRTICQLIEEIEKTVSGLRFAFV